MPTQTFHHAQTILKANITVSDFPEDCLFGVATAAYPIEGEADNDGRGPSIWDAFSHAEGKVKNYDTGDIAYDHHLLLESGPDLINSLMELI